MATLALVMLLQTDLPVPAEVLDPGERARIEKKEKIEDRIKIYCSASIRYQKAVESAASRNEFDAMPENLKLWRTLLSSSLKDIEANLKKKKSRALINYEIHLRKTIGNVQKVRIKAPADQQESFDSWISEAEEVRKKIVEILFQN